MKKIYITYFLDAFTNLRKATITFVTSVRPPARNNSAATEQTFMKFETCAFFEKLLRKPRFH